MGKNTDTGLKAARITRMMRKHLGRRRISRGAREAMVGHAQRLCNYLLDKFFAHTEPLKDGAKHRWLQHKHIAAALRADPELGAMLGASARLLKTRRVKLPKKTPARAGLSKK